VLSPATKATDVPFNSERCLERNYRCRCGDARAVRSLTQVVRKFPPGPVGAEVGRAKYAQGGFASKV